MDGRLRFVARLLEGEKMSDLCREFDVSRKTGYKISAASRHCRRVTDRNATRHPPARGQILIALETEFNWTGPDVALAI